MTISRSISVTMPLLAATHGGLCLDQLRPDRVESLAELQERPHLPSDQSEQRVVSHQVVRPGGSLRRWLPRSHRPGGGGPASAADVQRHSPRFPRLRVYEPRLREDSEAAAVKRSEQDNLEPKGMRSGRDEVFAGAPRVGVVPCLPSQVRHHDRGVSVGLLRAPVREGALARPRPEDRYGKTSGDRTVEANDDRLARALEAPVLPEGTSKSPSARRVKGATPALTGRSIP
jgi:hypothetical protein